MSMLYWRNSPNYLLVLYYRRNRPTWPSSVR